MELAGIAIVAGAIAAIALGGRLRHLGRVSLRAPSLLFAGAGIEFVSDWVDGTPGLVAIIAGYVFLLAFAACNLRLTGMVLIFVGLLSNLTVIALNGGMPVRGVPPGVSFGARHRGEESGDHLVGLGDVVDIGPLGQMVSGGDIVLAAGAAALTFRLLRPPRRQATPIRL